MRFYLSGGMRGFPEHNYPMFERVAADLREQGYDILSPTDVNPQGTDRAECMANDLRELLTCDGVLVLPNWQRSPGACNEVAMAWAVNLPVYQLICEEGGSAEIFPLQDTSVTIPRELQYYEQIPLLGVCGYAQSGKDTIATYLVRDYGYARVAFADALRDMLFALNPIAETWFEPEGDGVGHDRVEDLIVEHGWDNAKEMYPEIRNLLQRLGTEAGRDILGEDTWVTIGEQKIESWYPTPVVISDCRFPNELQMVRRRGGTLIWVDRPGVGPKNAHASEHSVTAADCNLIVKNDGTVEDLYTQLDLLMANLDWDPSIKPVVLS